MSYPFGVLTWILLGPLLDEAKTSKPCLWLMGDKDNFTSASKFSDRVRQLIGAAHSAERVPFHDDDGHPSNCALDFKGRTQAAIVVADADHFWFGQEEFLAELVSAWIQARLVDDETPVRADK